MHSSPTKEIILVPRWSKCTFSHPLKDEKDVTDLPLEVKCTCIVCLDTSKYEKKTIALSSSISSHRGPEQRRRTVSRNAYNVRSNKTGKPRLFLPFNADLESWPHVTAQTIYRYCYHGLSEGDQLLTLQKPPSLQRETRDGGFPSAEYFRRNRIHHYRDRDSKVDPVDQGVTHGRYFMLPHGIT